MALNDSLHGRNRILEIKNPNSKIVSSLGIKYPTFRDHPLHSAHLWLEGKRADDGAEGLWRIHDSLYDLTDFIYRHPGGSDWLTLTRGTDITEAFEAHHIFETAHDTLPQYFVRKAATPRNYPFTFEKNGFYNILRRNIRERLEQAPEAAANRSKYIADLLLAGYFGSALAAARYGSYTIGAVSGVLLGLTAIAAHNFFHQRDNIRMYYFDFTMMHSREWRVSHALSHHIYPNTVNDLEISSFEPWIQYLPAPKMFFFKYLPWIYSPIVYSLMFFVHYIKTTIQLLLNKEKIPLEMLLPLTVPTVMYFITGQPVSKCAAMYLWIQLIGSIYFSIVGVNAAHHHPDIFHDGDTPRAKEELDWGIFQLDAVMDRKDITGSHFLVLTNFGDHALHHLFPTIDHGKLEYLYPAFLETCDKFGLTWRLTSQLELVKGQYKQLAREERNPNPPGSKKQI